MRVGPPEGLAGIGRGGRLAVGSQDLEGQHRLPGGQDALGHRLAVLVKEEVLLGGDAARHDGPVPRLAVQVVQAGHVKVHVPAALLDIVDDLGDVRADAHLQPLVTHAPQEGEHLVDAPFQPQAVGAAAMVVGPDRPAGGDLSHVAGQVGEFEAVWAIQSIVPPRLRYSRKTRIRCRSARVWTVFIPRLWQRSRVPTMRSAVK